MNSEALGVFSAVRISYPHFVVEGIRLTGERGNMPTMGYDEDGKAVCIRLGVDPGRGQSVSVGLVRVAAS